MEGRIGLHEGFRKYFLNVLLEFALKALDLVIAHYVFQ